MSSSSTVADLKASLGRRLESIEGYSLVQLRECRGPLSLHAELVDAVRQYMSVVENQLEVNHGWRLGNPRHVDSTGPRACPGRLRDAASLRWGRKQGQRAMLIAVHCSPRFVFVQELTLATEDEETEHARREALSQLDILQARVDRCVSACHSPQRVYRRSRYCR